MMASATLGATAAKPQTDFSAVLWDLVFSCTGFTRTEIEHLRETAALDESVAVNGGNATGGSIEEEEQGVPLPSKDVCDLVTSDLEWCNEGAVDTLRESLHDYLVVLVTLKAENARRQARKLKTKNYVEDTHYAMLRKRETECRVTLQVVREQFEQLTLTKRRIAELTSEVLELTKVTQLLLCENALKRVDYLPPAVRVASFAGNQISVVDGSCLARAPHLVALCLSCNCMTTTAFVMSCPSLVLLDLSYNCLTSVSEACETFQAHPSLHEVLLIGNPIALLPNYRKLLCGVQNLSVLDDAPITEAERRPPSPPADPSLPPPQQQQAAATTIEIVLERISNVHDILPSFSMNEENNGVQQQQQGSKPGAAKQSGGQPSKGERKGAAATAPQQTGPTPKRTTLCLSGMWCDTIKVDTGEIDLAPPPPPVEETKNVKGAKAKSHEAPPPPTQNEVALQHRFTFAVPLSELLCRKMLMPLQLHCHMTEADVAPSTDGSNIPSAGESGKTSPVPEGAKAHAPIVTSVGVFLLDLAPLTTPEACACGEVKATSQTTCKATLQVDEITLSDMALAVRRMRTRHEELSALDKECDARVPTPGAAEAPPIPAPGSKKPAAGAKGDRSLAKASVTEETLLRQSESSARKAELEDLMMKIKTSEKYMEKLRGAAVTLSVRAACNPVAPPAAEPPHVQEPEKKDAKKRK